MSEVLRLQGMTVEEVGSALFRKFPDRDPLEVPLPEVRKLLRTLPGYRPEGRLGKKLLEAIWRAWNEEFEEED